MNSIETSSLLVRIGITKSTLRRWIKHELLVISDKKQKILTLTDTFSMDSLLIRLPFILIGDSNHAELAGIFHTELGKNDLNLPVVLKDLSHIDVVENIGTRNNLNYSLRPFSIFKV